MYRYLPNSCFSQTAQSDLSSEKETHNTSKVEMEEAIVDVRKKLDDETSMRLVSVNFMGTLKKLIHAFLLKLNFHMEFLVCIVYE